MNKLVCASLLILSSATAYANFEGDNRPSFFDKNYNYKFSAIPSKGQLSVDRTPWTSSYWPHQYGGIAFRWFDTYKSVPSFAPLYYQEIEVNEEILKLKAEIVARDHSPSELKALSDKIAALEAEQKRINNDKANHFRRYFFDIKRPQSLSDVKSMSQAELDRLSPAEKYDIYVGDYTFKLTKDVLKLTSPFDAYWEGICNGWASASLEFHEPKKVSVTNKDGIRVNFASADLKGLLAHYHAAITNNVMTRKKNIANRVGKRCAVNFPKESWFIKNDKEYYNVLEKGKLVAKEVPSDCIDINAGAFHVIVANQIGLKNEGFVAEIVRDSEVWNQPVFAFDSQIVETLSRIKPSATKGTTKQIRVQTKMYYANDGGKVYWDENEKEENFMASWEPTNGTAEYSSDFEEYEYILDLDNKGNIIGGQWLTYERPDFLWIKKSKGFLGNRSLYGIVAHMNELQNLVELR